MTATVPTTAAATRAFNSGYQAALRDLTAKLDEAGVDGMLGYLRDNLLPEVATPATAAAKTSRKVSASSVSNFMHRHCGIITLPDFRRQGYRVTGARGTGRVTVYCNFDSEFVSASRARDLAYQLERGGYEVEVNDQNEGILRVTGRK